MEEFKPVMKVIVRNESGYKEALRGLSFNKNQRKSMAPVAQKLAPLDYGHNKFLESIYVWLEVKAPRYWWQEADTFRISTKQSESTMHTILNNCLTQSNFETPINQKYLNELNDHLINKELLLLKSKIPEGFIQRRLWCMSYKTLRNIIIQRKDHRLPHWRMFIKSVLKQIKNPELFDSIFLPTIDEKVHILTGKMNEALTNSMKTLTGKMNKAMKTRG